MPGLQAPKPPAPRGNRSASDASARSVSRHHPEGEAPLVAWVAHEKPAQDPLEEAGGNGGSETRRSLRLEGSTWPSPLSTCRPAWLRTRTELKAGSRLSLNQILTFPPA